MSVDDTQRVMRNSVRECCRIHRTLSYCESSDVKLRLLELVESASSYHKIFKNLCEELLVRR